MICVVQSITHLQVDEDHGFNCVGDDDIGPHASVSVALAHRQLLVDRRGAAKPA